MKKRIGPAALIGYGAGLLFVLWIAVKSAPLLDKGGLLNWLSHFSEGLLKEPLAFEQAKSTPLLCLVLGGSYLLVVLYVLTTRKNKRPGEEYGSAAWGDARALARKYEERKKKVEIR